VRARAYACAYCFYQVTFDLRRGAECFLRARSFEIS